MDDAAARRAGAGAGRQLTGHMPDEYEHRPGAPVVCPRAGHAGRRQDRDDPRLLPIAIAPLSARSRRAAGIRRDRRAQRRRSAGRGGRNRHQRGPRRRAAGRARRSARGRRRSRRRGTLYRTDGGFARGTRQTAQAFGDGERRCATGCAAALGVAAKRDDRLPGRSDSAPRAPATRPDLRACRRGACGGSGHRRERGEIVARWCAAPGAAPRGVLDAYIAAFLTDKGESPSQTLDH